MIVIFVLLAVPGGVAMIFYHPAGVVVSIRTDRRLQEKVDLDLKNPSTSEVLDQLQAVTGLKMDLDEGLHGSTPHYGRVRLPATNSWSAMEWLAQKQPLPASWQKTNEGYRLIAARPFRGGASPFAAAIIACLALMGIGTLAWSKGWNPLTGLLGPSTARAWQQLNYRRHAVAGITVVMVGGAAYLLGNDFRAPQLVNAGLRVAPQHLNFGTVWEQDAYRWIIPIENVTDRRIEIEGFDWSCGCLGVEPKELVIEPGEKAEVSVVMNLAASCLGGDAAAVRDAVVQVFPHVRGEARRGWTIAGRVRDTLPAG
jgi:hypothetical protein